MDCYFIKACVETKEVKPVYVATKSQVAYLLMKASGVERFRTFLTKLGIPDLHAPA